jgi:hypothetical protein
LQGKQVVPRLGELDIDLTCVLWKDYAEWAELHQHTNYWHSVEVLKTYEISVEVYICNEPVFVGPPDRFGNIKIHVEFDDTVFNTLDLRIKISGMENLPINDGLWLAVRDMFQIESVKIQGIEITHMLDNTVFGKDVDAVVSMNRPIYSWLVENHSRILPGVFDLPTVATFLAEKSIAN